MVPQPKEEFAGSATNGVGFGFDQNGADHRPSKDNFTFNTSAFHKARKNHHPEPQPYVDPRLRRLQTIIDAIEEHDIDPCNPQTPHLLAEGYKNRSAQEFNDMADLAEQEGEYEIATLLRAVAADLRGNHEGARAIHEPLRLGYSGKKLLEYQRQRLITDQRRGPWNR